MAKHIKECGTNVIAGEINWTQYTLVSPLCEKHAKRAVILITTSLSSMWIGVPTAINRIADDWTERATTAGIPSEYESEIVFVATVAVYHDDFVGMDSACNLHSNIPVDRLLTQDVKSGCRVGDFLSSPSLRQ